MIGNQNNYRAPPLSQAAMTKAFKMYEGVLEIR